MIKMYVIKLINKIEKSYFQNFTMVSKQEILKLISLFSYKSKNINNKKKNHPLVRLCNKEFINDFRELVKSIHICTIIVHNIKIGKR